MFKPTMICKLFATGSPRNPRRSSTRLRPALMALEDRRLPSGIFNLDTLVVNNPTDTHVDGQLDLREAIKMANDANGDTTIKFSSVFDTKQTITLQGKQLQVTDKNLTIDGPAAGLTVNGNGKSRILDVASSNAKVVIKHLNITGGFESNDYGGGVYNRGNLKLVNCNVTDNRSQCNSADYGGGLYNYYGTLTLENCTVSNNVVNIPIKTGEDWGGGLANYDGTVILKNSSFINNSAVYSISDNGRDSNEGGIPNNIDRSYGGGVYNYGNAYLTNCTFDGNSAIKGGGLFNHGDATVVSCTLTNNTAGIFGGGMYLRTSLDMWDTIVAGNTGDRGGNEIDGAVHSGGNNDYSADRDHRPGGHNLIGTQPAYSTWGTSDLLNVTNPGLLALASNGGPTQTVALAPTSPAIRNGMKVKFAGEATDVTTDQRGFKLDTPNPDIGAYQFQRS
jgi:hypothetical protein